MGHRESRRSLRGYSRSATRPSATWLKRCRCCCPDAESTTDVALHTLDDGATPPSRETIGGNAARQRGRRLARAGGDAAVRLQQADHRWIPCRRVPAARRARPRSRERHERRRDRASTERALGATCRRRSRRCWRRRPAMPINRSPIRSISRIRSKDEVDSLGEAADWQAEWKWDGIRAQVIRRKARASSGPVARSWSPIVFPEIAAAAALLPDGTVLDGEIMPWRDGQPLPFAQLQRRIGRKTLGPKILSEVPVVLIAYDVMESDSRGRPQLNRWPCGAATTDRDHRVDARASVFVPSPVIPCRHGATRATRTRGARDMGAEGLMLKRARLHLRRGSAQGRLVEVEGAAIYGRRRDDLCAGRPRPARVAAHRLHLCRLGRRRLVPFAKAYSGLTDAEIRELDAWIRRNTVEKFGPVRHVKPFHVFELGVRGHPGVPAPQIGCRRSLPANSPMANR